MHCFVCLTRNEINFLALRKLPEDEIKAPWYLYSFTISIGSPLRKMFNLSG
jgi:hypothetical protein